MMYASHIAAPWLKIDTNILEREGAVNGRCRLAAILTECYSAKNINSDPDSDPEVAANRNRDRYERGSKVRSAH